MTFTMGQIQYQEWLVPYLEGTLDLERRALLEARLATDSVLAQEVEALRSTVGHLREAAARHRAAKAATRPAQADLWPRLRTRLASPAPPLPLISPRVWWGTGLAAACGLALVLVWEPLHHHDKPRHYASVRRIASRDIDGSRKTIGPLNTPPPPPVVAPAKPAAPKAAPQPPAAPPMSTGDPFAKPSTVAGAVHQPQATYFSTAPKHMTEGAPVTAVRPQFAPPKLTNRIAENGAGASDAHRQMPAFDSSGSASAPALPTPAPTVADRNRRVAQGEAGNAAAPNDKVASKSATSDQPPKVATNPGNAPAFVPETAPSMPTSRPSEDRSMAGLARPQTAANLETWLETLAQTQQPPLLGTDEGAQQAAQVVTDARDAGAWNALRLRVEAQRRRQPQSLVVGRMLAAVYENGGQGTAALAERRRISRLLGTSAEDWFQLARLAEAAGDRNTARQAYQRSLTPNAAPLSAEHADIAHQRLFP